MAGNRLGKLDTPRIFPLSCHLQRVGKSVNISHNGQTLACIIPAVYQMPVRNLAIFIRLLLYLPLSGIMGPKTLNRAFVQAGSMRREQRVFRNPKLRRSSNESR